MQASLPSEHRWHLSNSEDLVRLVVLWNDATTVDQKSKVTTLFCILLLWIMTALFCILVLWIMMLYE